MKVRALKDCRAQIINHPTLEYIVTAGEILEGELVRVLGSNMFFFTLPGGGEVECFIFAEDIEIMGEGQ